jgi:methionyl-tRNA formyltransferase
VRVAFAGTPEFAAAALRSLAEAGHEVVLVLTQPDRPAGRGMRLQASAVKQAAMAAGWPVAQPRGLRPDGRFADDAQAARAALTQARPDVLVVAAYGLILPRWVLELPPRGCLNIHASLLPRWRGAAPIQRAIEAGDRETGITIMQMDEGLDTGAMLLREPVPIDAQDTAATLHDRLAALGARLVVQALDGLGGGALTPAPQPAEGATYAKKIEKAEAAIDWRADAAQIERRVRAFDPAPGATFVTDGEVCKLWRARVAEPTNHTPPAGTLVELGPQRLGVVCGSGVLELLEVQRPGGKRVALRQLLASGTSTLRPGARVA